MGGASLEKSALVTAVTVLGITLVYFQTSLMTALHRPVRLDGGDTNAF